MASLIPNSETLGRISRRIEFQLPSGRRARLRLGQTTSKEGNDFCRRVEELLSDLNLGRSHDGSLCTWLNRLSPKMQLRLQRLSLTKEVRSAQMLGDFLNDLKARARVKDGTLTVYSHTIRNLTEHFGSSRVLHTIDDAAAQGFKEFLEVSDRAYGDRALARATINRRIKMARQFFKRAVDTKLISENPFKSVTGGSHRNPSRLFAVEATLVDCAIQACDDQDWKLLLALGRYGGIRIPSEVVKLRWQHVDFLKRRILIHSPRPSISKAKIRGAFRSSMSSSNPHGGLQKGWSLTSFVIENAAYRQPNANLRTQFVRVLKSAGLKPWRKAFQNMRATRETELIERMDLKSACQIIGNSEIVALQHYQMLRPQYLESAIERDRAGRRGAKSGAPYSGNDRKRPEAGGIAFEPTFDFVP